MLLGLALLFVAPFLHGSARNQAHQADVARPVRDRHPGERSCPKLPAKKVSTSTWVWGTAETAAVVVVMIGGYRSFSGRLAARPSRERRRARHELTGEDDRRQGPGPRTSRPFSVRHP
ncbi:hypothetical protein GCM10020229_57850 [Kitasatospora albolonga]|uniref:hypothetical protein n=1 Tax=Kitasatospora albolonga TaxID=68173 RepID=UPI0031E50DC2